MRKAGIGSGYPGISGPICEISLFKSDILARKIRTVNKHYSKGKKYITFVERLLAFHDFNQ